MDGIEACSGCQARMGPGERFCSACGRPVDDAPPGTAVATRSEWILPTAPRPPYPQQDPPDPPRQPPRRHDGNRAGSPRVLWALMALLVAGVVAAVVVTRPFGLGASHQAPDASASLAVPVRTASAAGAATASPGTASPSASAATARQAAARVAVLLSHSVSDRAAISSAATDISRCGPRLDTDAQVFGAAASSRKSLLASLAALPGRGTLPAAVVSDLTAAWQASVAADQAYARWAGDEVAKGCVARDTSDPGYQAALAPDATATKDKTAFTSAWNPVAARYGLTSYQPGQL